MQKSDIAKVVLISTLVVLMSLYPSYTDENLSAHANAAPLSTWTPYGPRMKQIIFTVFTNSGTEMNSLLSNGLDVYDSLVSQADVQNICSSQSILCTGGSPVFDMLGIDFDHQTTFWGCNFADHSNACGVEIRRGLSHLINKNTFLHTLDSSRDLIDCFSPRAHFIAAGLATGKDSSCNLTGVGSGKLGAAAMNDRINFWIRSDNPSMNDLGYDLARSVNTIMGRLDNGKWAVATCAATYEDVVQSWFEDMSPNPPESPWDHLIAETPMSLVSDQNTKVTSSLSASSPTIFCFPGDPFFTAGYSTNVWNMATAIWSPPSSIQQLYLAYNSKFSTDGFKDPALDSWTNMLEFNATLSNAVLSAQTAEFLAGTEVVNIPIASRAGVFAYFNGWSGVVNQVGTGVSNLWSSLNAWNPDPASAGAIRWGLSRETISLNVFTASSPWELLLLGGIYDSMMIQNPMNILQQIDRMTTSHATSFDSTKNLTTQTWHLRNDLKWQDGQSLTAADVVYSIIAYRDVPSGIFQSHVANVVSAVATDQQTVQVKLSGQSVFFDYGVGSVPIIPKHIWAPLCGDPPVQGASCRGVDPMASGIMIGSGPWACLNTSNRAVGGTCTQNGSGSQGTQAVSAGGRILFSVFSNLNGASWMRCCPGVANSPLHIFSWVDMHNTGTVDITDLASVSSAYGTDDPYWNTGYPGPLKIYHGFPLPAIGSDPNVVDASEMATVSIYFGHTLTGSYPPSSLTGLDPVIDPFWQNG